MLNLESNYISGPGFVAILEAVNKQQALQILKVANQVGQCIIKSNKISPDMYGRPFFE